MIRRSWWENLLSQSLRRRPIVWLAGVRRSGKTILCKMMDGARYFDCELPSVRRALSDPESFFKAQGPGLIILDEVHRLEDPALPLKIAADHFSGSRVIATGSSTLGASAKFRDTLAGRKADVLLYPLCRADDAFPFHDDLDRRFLFGGLPPLYLSDHREDRDYSEWIESFWARDILELFRLERRASFFSFIELLLTQSGGRFEANSFASPCGVSRPTIVNYLAILEATLFVHVVRPFSTRHSSEIVSTPVVYAFDTGFVSWAQGLHEMPSKDRGLYWEHLVINELAARLQSRDIRHWRSKKGREVDFVIVPRGKPPIAIEAKYRAEAFDPAGMVAMRELHPGTVNFVVSRDVHTPYNRTYGALEVRFRSLDVLAEEVSKA